MSTDTVLDGRILQTAVSLETVLVQRYQALAEHPAAGAGGSPLRELLRRAAIHHQEHLKELRSRAEALGIPIGDAPHQRLEALLAERTPGLATAGQLLDLVATLEQVLTETYLSNLVVASDPALRDLLAGLMGVEAQHLALARTLAEAHAVDPVAAAAPAELATVPATTVKAGLADTLLGTTRAVPPEEAPR